MVEHGPESPSSDWGILTGPCKQNNETSSSIKYWELLDWLKKYLWSQEGCYSLEFINCCTAVLTNEIFYHSTEQTFHPQIAIQFGGCKTQTDRHVEFIIT